MVSLRKLLVLVALLSTLMGCAVTGGLRATDQAMIEEANEYAPSSEYSKLYVGRPYNRFRSTIDGSLLFLLTLGTTTTSGFMEWELYKNVDIYVDSGEGLERMDPIAEVGLNEYLYLKFLPGDYSIYLKKRDAPQAYKVDFTAKANEMNTLLCDLADIKHSIATPYNAECVVEPLEDSSILRIDHSMLMVKSKKHLFSETTDISEDQALENELSAQADEMDFGVSARERRLRQLVLGDNGVYQPHIEAAPSPQIYTAAFNNDAYSGSYSESGASQSALTYTYADDTPSYQTTPEPVVQQTYSGTSPGTADHTLAQAPAAEESLGDKAINAATDCAGYLAKKKACSFIPFGGASLCISALASDYDPLLVAACNAIPLPF